MQVLKYHKEFGVYYFCDGDPYVFTEQKRDYGRVAARADDAVVLDFGAHCGFFNVFLSRNYSPAKIISVEPDKRLAPILRKNARCGTEVHIAAVVDKSFKAKEIEFYLGKNFAATNSIEPYRGREKVTVPTIKFQDLLKRGVTFIKCDCEGGEYSLDWTKLPKRVHTIAIEFHYMREAWKERMKEIDAQLVAQGFEHVRQPKVNDFRKVDTGLYIR